MKRHICGILENDHNRGPLGSPFSLRYQRTTKKYIRIDEVEQRIHGKKKRFNLMHHLDLVAPYLHPLMLERPQVMQ